MQPWKQLLDDDETKGGGRITVDLKDRDDDLGKRVRERNEASRRDREAARRRKDTRSGGGARKKKIFTRKRDGHKKTTPPDKHATYLYTAAKRKNLTDGLGSDLAYRGEVEANITAAREAYEAELLANATNATAPEDVPELPKAGDNGARKRAAERSAEDIRDKYRKPPADRPRAARTASRATAASPRRPSKGPGTAETVEATRWTTCTSARSSGTRTAGTASPPCVPSTTP